MGKFDEMYLEIVECRRCGKKEYWGMLTYINGRAVCRECAYEAWEDQSPWRRSSRNFTFPIYEDGHDYTQQKKED